MSTAAHTILAYLLLILPLAGAALLALVPQATRKLAGAVATSATALSFVCTIVLALLLPSFPQSSMNIPLIAWAPEFGFQLGLLIDPLSLLFAFVITGVGALIHLFSQSYMNEEGDLGRYFSGLNIFIFAMLLLVLSDNFLGLLIGWAGVGLASYLLIGYWYERPAAVLAARKAFVINTVGDVGIILALVLLWNQLQSVSYAEVFTRIGDVDDSVLLFASLALLVGAFAKSAQFPLHTWLPDAMEGPTPVSALIHAATMVTAGVYLAIRAYPLFQSMPFAMSTIAWIGAVSALYGALAACAQTDLKRVLAYSTMSQVGYMMLSAGLGAYVATAFHFFTHAFFKALLFLTAAWVIHAMGGEQDIRRMGGLAKRLPKAYRGFLIGSLALVGAPLFSGFFSKEAVLSAARIAGSAPLWWIGLIVVGLTGFYTFRLLLLVFWSKPQEQPDNDLIDASTTAEHIGRKEFAAVLPLALLAVVAGWIEIPGLWNGLTSWLGPALKAYPAWELRAHGTDLVTTTLTIVLALAGFVLAWNRFGPKAAHTPLAKETGLSAWAKSGFGLDSFYTEGILAPLQNVAIGIGRLADPVVLAGFFNGIALVLLHGGQLLARNQSGRLRYYSLGMMVGVAALAIYWVR